MSVFTAVVQKEDTLYVAQMSRSRNSQPGGNY